MKTCQYFILLLVCMICSGCEIWTAPKPVFPRKVHTLPQADSRTTVLRTEEIPVERSGVRDELHYSFVVVRDSMNETCRELFVDAHNTILMSSPVPCSLAQHKNEHSAYTPSPALVEEVDSASVYLLHRAKSKATGLCYLVTTTPDVRTVLTYFTSRCNSHVDMH
jgi:hypothetical protein